MKKQKKSPWKALVYMLFLGSLGAIFGYFGISLLAEWLPFELLKPQGGIEKFLLPALALFAVWFVIAFHETGHLVAGLAQGFRFALYTAGLLGARGTSRGPRFFLNRNINLMGGLAATFPEQLESGPELRRKFALIVAAGPASSLLLALAAAGFTLAGFSSLADAPSAVLRAGVVFSLTASLFSTLIFLATIVPSRADGFLSDGARLLSLLGNNENSRYEEASLSVTTLLGAGKLPGEYPEDLMAQLTSRPADTLLGLTGHYTAFLHHFDRGETEQAIVLAERVAGNIEAVPEAFQAYYLKEVAFFYAFALRDADKTNEVWAGCSIKAERQPDSALYRVKAALALLEDDTRAAATWIEKGIAKIPDLPFAGQRRFEEKWLAELARQTGQPVEHIFSANQESMG